MDEAALHELLSGHRRGVRESVLRAGLYAASLVYSSVMRLRNFGYDKNWLRTDRVPIPVISLGNITTGGTGKTPVSAWLANWLTGKGLKPGLLSRGYRSLTPGTEHPQTTSLDKELSVNDEKLVLDRLCPGVPHLQQRDRVASAQRAVRELGCNVLLLDDGFQHRRLHRDLDLVLVDALQPWGYGYVLPRGLLREPLSGLRRADLILITRADQCTESQRESLRNALRRFRGNDDCVEIKFAPRRLVDLDWQPQPLESLIGKTAMAFCGIGNPEGFRKTIASIGVECKVLQTFPDHHHYTQSETDLLAKTARDQSADIVLTTQKDLVKFATSEWHGPLLFAIEIGVEILSGQKLLESHLRRILDV